MWNKRGQTVNSFGLDSTNLVDYTFNQQGFRSNVDYISTPQTALFGCSLVFGIGVEHSQITSSLLQNCYNYGLAGNYNNNDIAKTVENFIGSNLYSSQIKMAIVWTDRNEDILESAYYNLKQFNIAHFFCGKELSYKNCYKFIPTIDKDVSKTHMGPHTHKMFYRTLCTIFNQ